MKKMLITAACFLPLFVSALNDALKIRIEGNSYSDETVVRFLPGATAQYDGNWDAWKFFSMNPNVPSAYTSIAPGQDLCINALPALASDTSADLFVAIPAQGNYVISATEPGAFDPSVGIFLQDLSTGSYYNLRSGNTFTFNLPVIAIGAPAYFRIHFVTSPQHSYTNASCSGELDGSLTVSTGGSTWGYTVSNSSGNVISGIANAQPMTLNGLAADTYFISWLNIYGQQLLDTFQVSQPAPVVASFTLSDTILQLPQAMLAPSNGSQNSGSYLWDFGDGTPSDPSIQPVHNYMQPGTYTVTLYAMNGSCSSSMSQTVTVLDLHTGLIAQEENNFSLSCDGVSMRIAQSGDFSYSLYDLGGRVLRNGTENGSATISVNDLPAGIYVAAVESEGKRATRKIMLTH